MSDFAKLNSACSIDYRVVTFFPTFPIPFLYCMETNEIWHLECITYIILLAVISILFIIGTG